MYRNVIPLLLFVSVQLTANPVVDAREKTSIALTTTVTGTVSEFDRSLAATLVSFIESAILEDDSIVVVERQQLESVLQELTLNQLRTADESLQLGKLVTADLLVMLELRVADAPKQTTAVIRIVEAKTAVIRGVTVVSDLDEAKLEDAAAQVSRYLSGVVRKVPGRGVTIAVLPFESVGRFDRLRHLELGVRDLVTSRLLQIAGTLVPAPDGNVPNAQFDADRPVQFEVLQRYSMEQLIRELDLIQSGFIDKNLLPKELPERRAIVFVKGEIDERQVDGHFLIVVRATLLEARTEKSLAAFEFSCKPAELESQLEKQIDRMAIQLGASKMPREAINADRGANEVRSLKGQALRDLHRFRRISPADFAVRAFRLPDEHVTYEVVGLAAPGTTLGRALMRKSIDRMESVLYIHPDDAEAAYALAFCFSLHDPETYQPGRADDLLRKVTASQPQTELAALALALLGQIAFHDQTGRLDVDQKDETAERLWFSFEQTPEKFRDILWARTLELFKSTQRSEQQIAEIIAKAVPYAERKTEQSRNELAGQIRFLAQGLVVQSREDSPLRKQALDLLRRWSDGPDPLLADFGRQGLASLSAQKKDFLAAAMQYEQSAAKLEALTEPQDRHKHDVQLVHAAKNYRFALQPERGLQLLRSFEPTKALGSASILPGMHGYEMAACLEALGQKQQALDTYLRTAEECPLIVPNTNLVERVKALGGVPLSKERDVDVRYLASDQFRSAINVFLATDGSRLFIGADGISTFDPDTEVTQLLKSDIGKVTCLKVRQRQLWVGTKANGAWRYELDSQRWSQFSTEQGLPDSCVSALAFYNNNVYVGVGTPAAGGLVRIDDAGIVHLIDDTNAPRVAPTHLIVDCPRSGCTNSSIHSRTTFTVRCVVAREARSPTQCLCSPIVRGGRTCLGVAAVPGTNQLARTIRLISSSNPPGTSRPAVRWVMESTFWLSMATMSGLVDSLGTICLVPDSTAFIARRALSTSFRRVTDSRQSMHIPSTTDCGCTNVCGWRLLLVCAWSLHASLPGNRDLCAGWEESLIARQDETLYASPQIVSDHQRARHISKRVCEIAMLSTAAIFWWLLPSALGVDWNRLTFYPKMSYLS